MMELMKIFGWCIMAWPVLIMVAFIVTGAPFSSSFLIFFTGVSWLIGWYLIRIKKGEEGEEKYNDKIV